MLAVLSVSADRRSAAKPAIVVGSDAAFGMGRMVELGAEGQADPTFKIFRSMSEARVWLGLDGSASAP